MPPSMQAMREACSPACRAMSGTTSTRAGRSTAWRLSARSWRTWIACYAERLEDMVLLVSEDGRRAAAEFVVHGTYKATDGDLPQATGQIYTLQAGAFFKVADGAITRVTMYYNLSDWLRQVGG